MSGSGHCRVMSNTYTCSECGLMFVGACEVRVNLVLTITKRLWL